MNIRNWSKQHTIGLLIGIATVLVFIPIVMYILGQSDNRTFSTMWIKFKISHLEKMRVMSLACISNLFWFHRFLKKESYNYAYGVIAATVIFLLIIIFYKFFY